MQLAYRHDERLGESYEALDGKKGKKTVGPSPCVTWQIVSDCWVFGLGSGPVFGLLRCFLPMVIRKSGRGICVSSFLFLCFFFVVLSDLPLS